MVKKFVEMVAKEVAKRIFPQFCEVTYWDDNVRKGERSKWFISQKAALKWVSKESGDPTPQKMGTAFITSGKKITHVSHIQTKTLPNPFLFMREGKSYMLKD